MNYQVRRGNKLEHYELLWVVIIAFVMIAFIVSSPYEIFEGLRRILLGRAILITDYMVIGGMGAAFINAALNGVVCILLMKITKCKATGATIAGIWLNIGFGLFGKNIINSIPIFLGIYLYARFENKKFSEYMLVTLLGTTLGPIVSEFVSFDSFASISSDLFGLSLGIVLGFILVPVSRHTTAVHKGFCLYNVGFAAGSLAMLFTFISKSFGFTIESDLHWYTLDQTFLFLMMIGIGMLFVIYGLIRTNKSNMVSQFKLLSMEPGVLPSDFLSKYGNICYLNMGILCLIGTLLLYAIGGDFNGPTIGGILTLMAFGCFGKTIRNCIPILIGACLCASLHIEDMTSPSTTLAILFSVGIAPIAGKYGALWGIVAGFVHVTLATNMSALNSGLNLYNNGFAAGFVCMILVPIIEVLQKKKIKLQSESLD